MKILHVITTLSTGGAEKLMVDLLPLLNQYEDNEVELAVFNTGETPFYKELSKTSVSIHVFSGPGNVYNPLHICRLVRLMRKFDIVHTHNTSPQLFAAIGSYFCKAKLFTTEHNTTNRRRGSNFFSTIDKWMYGRYEKIICISNQAEENLRCHLGSSNTNICTIFNGVNISRFVEAKPSSEIEERYGKKVVITMVAGFRPQKDQPTLIKAMKLLSEEYYLLIVGDGERRGEFEELIKVLSLGDRVHLLGLRTDVPQILKASDIIVMSTHYEGLSLSNIEGMASGKPFVASDVEGIREITRDYGVLFPHGDYKSLADVILKLTTDEEYRAEVVKKCQERAMQYDISTMAENYNKVYKELMKQKS